MKKILIISFNVIIFFIVSLSCIDMLYAAVTGKITGRVIKKDTGEPLPGANIIILGTYLGAATDEDGRYVILNVPPGVYSVQASMIGYKKITKEGVVVSVDQITTVNFEMEQEVIKGEEVVVTAERDILHKEVSVTQQVVSSEQILEISGVRTVENFLDKLPGVTNARYLEIRGGSAEQTGSMVNGLLVVDFRMGKAEPIIPLSAIEQISVVTGGFGAEYGNFRSGLINVTTKTGYRDAYHGRLSISANLPRMKRFGKSIYDIGNYALKPYLDPIVGFEGTKNGWLMYTNGDTGEAEYLAQQHDAFTGWKTLATLFYLDYQKEATPMDLYLWACWNHMVVPDWDKLEELYPEWTTQDPEWEKKKKAIEEHAHEKEGTHSDYNIDFGFGGPVPLIGKFLGDATFYLSHQTNNTYFIQPTVCQERPSDWKSTTMLTLKSYLTRKTTLNLTLLYRLRKGVAQIQNIALATPTLYGRGGLMDENNVGDLRGVGETYYWHPTFFHPKNQTIYVAGLKLNHMISSRTYWDLTLQYSTSKYYMGEKLWELRDKSYKINFGPIYLDEKPYGRMIEPRWGMQKYLVYDPEDSSKYWEDNGLSSVYGLGRRFSGKSANYFDDSYASQYSLRYDFSSQVTLAHLIKAGFEVNYFDLNNKMYVINERELYFHRQPWVAGAYVQDQITIEGMVATIGVRFDYYNTGDEVWPTGDPFNVAAFSTGTERGNISQLVADQLAGISVIWRRWNTINDTTGGTLFEKTKNHYAISPRLGISFPVTERSKFYFNYGHFRSNPAYNDMYLYMMSFRDVGLRDIGNPNLEPPRTIQYELGITYNLLDMYLINLSTYYKDVSGEPGSITYQRTDGTVRYGVRTNNRYEDIQGFEASITKQVGKYITGWLNYRYMIEKYGYVGRSVISDDEVWNEQYGYYEAEEIRPSTRPMVTGNVTFHVPETIGPGFGGIYPIGGWLIGITSRWVRGGTFTWNPANIRNYTNNLRWPDYLNFDMRISKRINFGRIKVSLFSDIQNLFNIKHSWMNEGWCFRNREDREKYLASLRLPMYDDPIYDNLREQNPGYYIPGNDKVGELRSDDKPYINDPDNKMFLYGYPRQIWFGLEINF
ncbi:MAG: TonB-dependent receptor [Candidatus Marinimicrobia bacterium]|nr:TonB-dependent receptor [Candidatus Neomarinimicrobiota bacterium]